jgi:hypothetical protein
MPFIYAAIGRRLGYREQIVRETMTFLRVIQASDILKVTADDVEEFIETYESNDKRQAALGLLDYIQLGLGIVG